MTTLGELAASIAHEVNQPLAAIVADATACLNWLQADRPSRDSIREALAGVVNDSNREGRGDRANSRSRGALVGRPPSLILKPARPFGTSRPSGATFHFALPALP